MLAHPEDLLPEALEAARGEMIRRNLPPARTASPEAGEELRALEIRVAEMESEKAALEAKLKAKKRSGPNEPAKAQGGWYAIFFLMSLLCLTGSYLMPTPEEARPMRMMGGALFVAGSVAKALSKPRRQKEAKHSCKCGN